MGTPSGLRSAGTVVLLWIQSQLEKVRPELIMFVGSQSKTLHRNYSEPAVRSMVWVVLSPALTLQVQEALCSPSPQFMNSLVLLMLKILHDCIYRNPTNYGSTAELGSCGI